MKVGILGASGYTGLELVRILLRHPEFELAVVTSEQQAGRPLAEAYPSLRRRTDLRFEAMAPEALSGRVELAFTALPHAASAPAVHALREAGLPVVDLSADFRLRDLATYESWYGRHAAPAHLGEAVYGLPELHRDALRKAKLAAAPGCYPTSALLPLAPLLRANLCERSGIHIDSKSGVSGAGRKPEVGYLFAELDGDVHAYNAGFAHRHAPEIEQEASRAAGAPVRVTFVPHLLPTVRGIATSVFVRPRSGARAADARAALSDAYASELFVRVLPEGELPSLRSVRGSNFCDVALVEDARNDTWILLSTLDNLGKGASGQAVQCANLMCGFAEEAGLLDAPWVP
ncbi:MAG TPA: N-acetyl-gamma-glutamyl-phosphate reductase [Myxococcota bacterium]|nr:N-acetyl-gamma-glutamyl-phosphate reductase [Myxococcota bacterium]